MLLAVTLCYAAHAKRDVLVLGSAGIGFETALYLASQGASVIITSRSKGRGDAALEALKRSSGMQFVVAMLLSAMIGGNTS